MKKKYRDESEALEKGVAHSVDILTFLLAPSPQRGRGSLLTDLLYRAQMPFDIDGYPAGGGNEKTSGGSTSDPTFGTVAARLNDVCNKCEGRGVVDSRSCSNCGGSGRRWADPIADAVEELKHHLKELMKLTSYIDKIQMRVMTTSVPTPGRQSSLQGNCIVCGGAVTGAGEDRLRRGMDNRCYLSWGSWKIKNPDNSDPGAQFHRFTVWRRENLTKAAF